MNLPTLMLSAFAGCVVTQLAMPGTCDIIDEMDEPAQGLAPLVIKEITDMVSDRAGGVIIEIGKATPH